MNKYEYMEMLHILDDYYRKVVVITWLNGLKVKCNIFLGMAESSTELGDEDYIGEYYTIVNEVEVLENGRDDSISIDENNGIEINIFTIPKKIELEDGTVLWEAKETQQ